MSIINDILTDISGALDDSDAFQAAIKIYQRPERAEDIVTGSTGELAIYLQPDGVRPDDSPFSLDFRIYPIDIILKYESEPQAGYDEETSWSLREASDKIDTLLDKLNDRDTTMTTNTALYDWQHVETDFDFKAMDEILEREGEKGANIKRIRVRYDFYTGATI